MNLIARGLGEVVALVLSEEIADIANAPPKIIACPCGGPPDQRPELGKGHFNGVQIRAAGRQEEKPCTDRPHGIGALGAFVG